MLGLDIDGYERERQEKLKELELQRKLTDLIDDARIRQRSIILSITCDKRQLKISPVGVFLVSDGGEETLLSPADLKEELRRSLSPVRQIIEFQVGCNPDLETNKGVKTHA